MALALSIMATLSLGLAGVLLMEEEDPGTQNIGIMATIAAIIFCVIAINLCWNRIHQH